MGGISLAAARAGAGLDLGESSVGWMSVLPPLLAIGLAIATGRILVSLAAAVVVGGLLTAVPGAPYSPGAWGFGLDSAFIFAASPLEDPVALQVLAFVVLVLAMIAAVIVGGGLQGIVEWLARFVNGPRSARIVTALSGLVIFIDDYANTMIVGTAMRPITDRHRVSREKLAFLVDATSAPVAGLAIVSTWVGVQVGYFSDEAQKLFIDSNGYSMLFDALPFRFYCIFMLIFVLANVLSGKDFGPMRRAEARARDTGALTEPDATPMTSEAFSAAKPDGDARVLARTAVIPFAALFACLFGGIWVDGGGMERLLAGWDAFFRLSVWLDVIGASANSVKVLAYGGGVGLLAAVVCSAVIGRVPLARIADAVRSGARSSALPIAILLLAWALKAACDGLGTGYFLVAVVDDEVSPMWFPAIIFVVASLTSFSTGTGFGTMGILIPIVTPIAYTMEGGVYGLVTWVTLASVLDGAIFGDHCSPISDTTIMSSIASSCDHIHHVRTQLPYSLTIGVLALVVGYIPAGLGAPSGLSFLIGTVAITGLYFLMKPSDRAEEAVEGGELPEELE